MTPRQRSDRGLITWLTENQSPIFVIDGKRRIRFFNQGCIQLFGMDPELVLGKPCIYHTVPETHSPQDILALLAPPVTVYEGNPMISPVTLESQGEWLIHYFPLQNSLSELICIIGVMTHALEIPPSLGLPQEQRLHLDLQSIRDVTKSLIGPTQLIGECHAMKQVVTQIQIARDSLAKVQIIGPRGSGKTLIAKTIHQGERGDPSRLALIDCALVPALEQKRILQEITRELEQSSREQIDNPGLIIKHIDHMPRDIQWDFIKLLNDHLEFSRVRLYTTSETSLFHQVAQDQFHEELAYMLTPLVMEVPPLSKRGQDIDLLSQYFLECHNRDRELPFKGISLEVLREFQNYSWPGEVAELEAVISEMVDLMNSESADYAFPQHLPLRFRSGQDHDQYGLPNQSVDQSLDQLLTSVEIAEIEKALDQSQGNKAQAAQILGITRARLYRRMESLKISDETSS